MLYIATVAHDDAPTVGLLLWKARRVLTDAQREYQFLVVDDGSTDGTAAVLESYQRALPLTLVRHAEPRGWAGCVDVIAREALARTDRPRRDVLALFPADFSASPDALPELLKRLDSGADLAVGEAPHTAGTRPGRWVRRLAPRLIGAGLRVSGVRDVLSGCLAVRLVCLRQAAEGREQLLETGGMAARAELVARTARHARRVATVDLPPAPHAGPAIRPIDTALELLRGGRRVRFAVAGEPS
jgi:hypothetical protein